MTIKISSTHLVRHLGEVLAEIKYKGNRVIIEKNHVPVAELRPLGRKTECKLAELVEIWGSEPSDPEFVNDLESVNRSDIPLDNPWDS